jgi:hypothetical protein
MNPKTWDYGVLGHAWKMEHYLALGRIWVLRLWIRRFMRYERRDLHLLHVKFAHLLHVSWEVLYTMVVRLPLDRSADHEITCRVQRITFTQSSNQSLPWFREALWWFKVNVLNCKFSCLLIHYLIYISTLKLPIQIQLLSSFLHNHQSSSLPISKCPSKTQIIKPTRTNISTTPNATANTAAVTKTLFQPGLAKIHAIPVWY